MSGDKHSNYQLSYITIQKNSTDTRNQYEYMKTEQFFENDSRKSFKIFTTIKQE